MRAAGSPTARFSAERCHLFPINRTCCVSASPAGTCTFLQWHAGDILSRSLHVTCTALRLNPSCDTTSIQTLTLNWNLTMYLSCPLSCTYIHFSCKTCFLRALSLTMLKGLSKTMPAQTAEMPGFYQGGEYDVAGFAVGAVKRDAVIDGTAIRDGDAVLALASSGVHSNGFSLVRKVLEARAGANVRVYQGKLPSHIYFAACYVMCSRAMCQISDWRGEQSGPCKMFHDIPCSSNGTPVVQYRRSGVYGHSRCRRQSSARPCPGVTTAPPSGRLCCSRQRSTCRRC